MSESHVSESHVSESLVSRVNPSVKLLLNLICMLLFVFVHDPRTTLYLFLIPVLTLLLFAKVTPKKFIVSLSPFLLIFLLTVWMLGVYGTGTTVVYQWGILHITREGLQNGLTIGLRMMGFVCYGMLFSMTTDVTLLVLSLMQQCKLPPRFAYALLAGFRFVPTFKEEYEQIKAAHRVRGVARVPGLKGKVHGLMRYTIPLLAQAIRKAERVAVALEARGFDGSWNRTFYRKTSIGRVDALYGVLLLGLNVAVLFVLK